MAMAMSHRNIVQTFDAGRADGRFYMVMELVPGCSLGSLLSRLHPRPLPIEIALFVGMEVAAALDYAHRFRLPGSDHPAGLVHRDVSPSNILLSVEGDVKLADFGVAKAAGRLTVTSVDVVKGKLEYMPPEQVAGEEEPRSDLFALGAILYEMTTGQPFRRGASLEEIERGPSRLIPPSEYLPAIPASLERLILRCLSPALEDRPRHAEELRTALSETAFRLQYQLGTGHDLHARLQSFLAGHLGDSASALDPAAADAARAMLERPPRERDAGFTVSGLLGGDPSPRALLSRELEVELDDWSSISTSSLPRPQQLDEETTTAVRARPAAGEPAASAATPPPSPRTLEQARALGWVVSRRRVALVLAALLSGLAVGALVLRQRGATSPTPAGRPDLRALADLSPPGSDRPRADSDGPRPDAVRPDSASPEADLAPGPRPVIPRRPGLLEINAIPWAVVFVDGRRVGETPLQGLALPPGQHRVRLESPTRKIVRTLTVTIRSGQTTSRLVSLTP
jgi:serine/threonine-protein kinase